VSQDAYGQGIDTLDYGDKPDLVVLGETLRDGLTPRSVMRFANATTRDATIAEPVAGMVCWLADVKQFQLYDGSTWLTPSPPVTNVTTGGNAATGFDLVSFSGRRSGPNFMINVAFTRTGANIAADGAGNIPDSPMGTLPSPYWPPEPIYASVGDGFGNGECEIDVDGTVTLRSWSSSGAIVTGRNLRITKSWLGD